MVNIKDKIIPVLWKCFGGFLLVFILFFTAVWNGWIGYMPDIEELNNPVSRSSSLIYSSDGQLLGTWSLNRQNRVLVDYDHISPYMVKALVATEDERFYEHSGVDFPALGRAIIKRGILRQKSAGGGSTITQQLSKQLYSETTSSSFNRLMQKPIEWMISIKLERTFTKEEIIAMYLNYFDFLYNAVGIKNAAETYFAKDPSDLTLCEAATLVGMCKNPSLYNPIRFPERSLQRRNVVLGQMLKCGYITKAEYDTACAEPLDVSRFHRVADHKEGAAPYLREYLRQYLMATKPDLTKYPTWNYRQFHLDSLAWENDPMYGFCNKNFKKDGSSYNIYTDGLRIYTTIDSRMQQYAEEAVHEHIADYLQPQFEKLCKNKKNPPYSNSLTQAKVDAILNRSMRQSERYILMKANGCSDEEIEKAFNTPVSMTVFSYDGEKDVTMTPMDSIVYYKKFLRTGFMSMDPMTGHVKAYVGGTDFKYFMYDMVSTGRRQVGSTIKPLLYSLAMQNGYTPCDAVPNQNFNYGGWCPRDGSAQGGMRTLAQGLKLSSNRVAAYIIMQLVNVDDFVSLIRNYGLNDPGIIPNGTLALGSCDVNVQEMVSAYTTFVNHGIHVAPMFITRIEDSDGNVIGEQNDYQPRMNEVISAQAADYMIEMMRGVIDGGTGRRVRGLGIHGEVAGKTGTTNNNSDAWFIAAVPRLVSGCWVGGEDRDIHFDSGAFGQGSAAALPIWAYYMKKIYEDKSLGYMQDEKFEMSPGYQRCSYEEEEELEDAAEGVELVL